MEATTSRRDKILVQDGEFPLTESDFRKIAALVHGEAGIVLTEGKANLVYSRLAKRLRAIGLRSFREYCTLIENEPDEREKLISAMTTNVTRFFREPHHFELLQSHLLADIAKKAKAGQRVRLWSAACSSGEEPYSIAATLLEAIPDAASYDLLVLATDIDPAVLAKARDGIYPASSIQSVPPQLRAKMFEKTKSEPYSVTNAVRAIVRFNELNLLSSWPMTGKFDVIFCRNVMIYFDEPTQDRIWEHFARVLHPGGTLFIGHSERISTERHPFDLTAQTTYRLRGGSRT